MTVRKGSSGKFFGAVYVITHDAFPGLVKVGRAKDPFKRLSNANVWCPNKDWHLLHYRFFSNARDAEFRTHAALGRERRLSGEWFLVHPEAAIHIIQGVKV